MAPLDASSNRELGKALGQLLEAYVDCHRGIALLMGALRQTVDESRLQAGWAKVADAAQAENWASYDQHWVADVRKFFSDLENS